MVSYFNDWLTANGGKDDIDDIGVICGPVKRQDNTEDKRQDAAGNSKKKEMKN